MSPTALRLSAIPLGLVAFAVRLVMTFWLEPRIWPDGDLQTTLALVGVALVLACIPFAAFALLAGGRRQHPRGLVLRRTRFVVPASAVYGGSMAILFMGLSGGFVFPRLGPGGAVSGYTVSVPLIGLFWAVALAFVLVQRPEVYLDPRGLTVRRLRSGSYIAWDEIAPGGPRPPTKRRPRYLTLHLNGPLVYEEFRPTAVIPVGWLHVDAEFLAAVIRHYGDHPENRDAIGTADELSRLRVVSGAGHRGPQALFDAA